MPLQKHLKYHSLPYEQELDFLVSKLTKLKPHKNSNLSLDSKSAGIEKHYRSH